MSQKKVDHYKEQKANRKKIMRQEKMKKVFRQCVLGVAGLAIVGWLGYSAYGTYMNGKPRSSVVIDYHAFDEYLSSITPQ